jgi:hypothetical protein
VNQALVIIIRAIYRAKKLSLSSSLFNRIKKFCYKNISQTSVRALAQVLISFILLLLLFSC